MHPSNLSNPQNIETALANSQLGFTAQVVSTIAECLCHTASTKEDLLYASNPERIMILLKGQYIEALHTRILSAANIRPETRFRLTDKGMNILKESINKPFESVVDTMLLNPEKENELTQEMEAMLREEKYKQLTKESMERCYKSEMNI